MDTVHPYYDQAAEIRGQGYKSKINALDPNVQYYIDRLLEEGKTDTFIAKDTNARYKLSETSSFGTLSYKAIATYRKQWERKRFTAIEGLKSLAGKNQSFIPNLQQQIKKLGIAEKLTHLITREFDIALTGEQHENNCGKPIQEVQTSRRQAFTMLISLIKLLQELDLIENPSEIEKKSNDNFLFNQQMFNAVNNLMREVKTNKKDDEIHRESIPYNNIQVDTI